MTDKAVISNLTWRSLEMQRALFPDMPIFVIPDELSVVLRPTTRKEPDTLHVASIGILANNDKDLRAFMMALRRRRACVVSREDGKQYHPDGRLIDVVTAWRKARRNGAAKAGGEATAKKAETDFWTKFAKIKDRWHLPAKKDNANTPLLAEAEIGSRATVKSYLGGYTREEWQRMTEARRQRILRRAYG